MINAPGLIRNGDVALSRSLANFMLLLVLCCLPLCADQPLTPESLNAPTMPARTVLVLYDSAGAMGSIGKVYAIQLENLLRHFSVTVTRREVERYKRGLLERYDVTMYMGVFYQKSLPRDFLHDVMRTEKTICWINQNLWHFDWHWQGNTQVLPFRAKFGFAYTGNSNGGYQRVLYKGVLLEKSADDPQIQFVNIIEPTRVIVHARAQHDAGDTVPYILQSANFWFVADNPFTHVGNADRYLAFADLLHPVLGHYHAEEHRALVRIEDVAPNTSPQLLREIADALSARGIPFLISVIPEYNDPTGRYNNGVPQSFTMSERPEFIAALHYMTLHGGQIVCHGYSHQSGSLENPLSGVSGEDAEFFRMVKQVDGSLMYAGPLLHDTAAWSYQRVQRAVTLLEKHDLTPIGWNTPHYAASEQSYQQIARLLPVTFCRGLYFASQKKGQTPVFLQQLTPYIIKGDAYNFTRIPETLGYLDPVGILSYYSPSMPEDIASRARANLVVRDGWASFFYHPMLCMSYLTETIDLLRQQGYTFVSIDKDIQ